MDSVTGGGTAAPTPEQVAKHPVTRQEYALYTPPIARLYATVRGWVDNRITGGYVWGTPRLGKSRAVRFWLGRLLADEPQAPQLFRMSSRAQERTTERAFLEDVLHGIGHELFNGRVAVLLDRVTRFFVTAAHQAVRNHIVLVIDEAQNMNDAAYRYLCNLQNRLDDAGVRLTVISVGSHELAYQHEAFVLAQDLHLTGRFMIHELRFDGIQSSAELEFVLRAYDEHSEWPDASGCSYTRFFLPAAFDQGFRLSEHAEMLWQEYRRQAGSAWRGEPELAMEHVAHAVEHLFRWAARCRLADSAQVVLEAALLEEAIAQTGFGAYMRAVRPLTRARESRLPLVRTAGAASRTPRRVLSSQAT